MLRRSSLLNPPNPSLSSEQPSQSILLNCPARVGPETETQTPSSPSTATSTSSLTTPSTSDGFPDTSSPSPQGVRPRSISRSTVGSTSTGTPGSTKVSFAPLPVVPPLKRRSTITLGVAARKNLLTGQGTAPLSPNGLGPRPSNSSGTKTVYMTDEDWEAYKKQYEKGTGNDPVDVGDLVKSGAKSLWRKVRSSRSPSASSSTSTASSAADMSSAQSSSSPQALSSRRGSAPNLAPMEHHPKLSVGLEKVEEETHGLHLTTSPNTPTSPTSPTSPRRSSEPFFGDSGPGPSRESSTTSSAAEQARAGRSDDPKRHITTVVEGGDDRDGDATPRRAASPVHDITEEHLHKHNRRPSPPPRLQDRLPDEDELEEEKEDQLDAEAEESPITPTSINSADSSFDPADRIPWATPVQRTESREHAGRDAAVLGFDRLRVGFSM